MLFRSRKYLDPEEMKLAFAFLFSMPGAPFLYYGDEIGMRQLDIPSVEGGYERTGARTPMQWDAAAKNSGFSPAPAEWLYTPLDPAADAPTVESQQDDPDSLLNEVRKLIAVRRANPALGVDGSISFVWCEKGGEPLLYLREAEGQRVLVALNPSAKPASCPCAFTAKQVLYAHGQAAALAGGVLQMAGESATFIEV